MPNYNSTFPVQPNVGYGQFSVNSGSFTSLVTVMPWLIEMVVSQASLAVDTVKASRALAANPVATTTTSMVVSTVPDRHLTT